MLLLTVNFLQFLLKAVSHLCSVLRTNTQVLQVRLFSLPMEHPIYTAVDSSPLFLYQGRDYYELVPRTASDPCSISLLSYAQLNTSEVQT